MTPRPRHAAARLRRATVRWIYRLLYGPLARLYDLAATVSSAGSWWDWQRAALPWVQGPRVLDLACGTGHFLVDLTAGGHTAYGIDRSPQMIRQARRRLARRGLGGGLALGDAAHLPVKDGAFSTVTMTFTGLSLDATVLAEARRVLVPEGRLMILDHVRLAAPTPGARWSRAVLGLTTLTPEYPIISRLREAGFSAVVHEAAVDGNTALVVVAEPNMASPPHRIHRGDHREHKYP